MILKKNLMVLLLALLVMSFCKGQYWQSMGEFTMPIKELKEDPSDNTLYAAGWFKYVNDTLAWGIAEYDGVIWDNLDLGTRGGFATSVEKHDNFLFVGGKFNYLDSTFNTNYAAIWDGQNWLHCGDPNQVVSFEVANSELFAIGYFDSINWNPIRYLAKWNGVTWEDFSPSPVFYPGTIPSLSKLVWYKGNYYLGGSFVLPNGERSILKLDGTNWVAPGQGLLGGAYVHDMEVYKDLLFIAGSFSETDGNVSSNVIAWDGQQWIDPFPGVQFNSHVTAFEVIGDTLYLGGGGIVIPGQAGMKSLAHYDGQEFCTFGNTYLGNTFLGQYQGRLLVMASMFNNTPNDTIRNLAEWIGGNSTDYCISQPISNLKPILQESNFNLFPNPATQTLNLQFHSDKNSLCTLQLFDATGRLVQQQFVETRKGENEFQFDVQSLSGGVYLLRVEGEEWYFGERWVKE